MTFDINELRRLAQAATPGPWVAAGPSFGESLPKYLNEVAVDREGDEDDGYSICNAPIGLNEECSDDMAFIAEANPLTIEELLDRLEAAEKERDALRAKVAEMEKQSPICRIKDIRRAHYMTKVVGLDPEAWLYALPGAQPAPSVPELIESLRCACNYIDKLGGVSQQYRAMIAAAPEAKP